MFDKTKDLDSIKPVKLQELTKKDKAEIDAEVKKKKRENEEKMKKEEETKEQDETQQQIYLLSYVINGNEGRISVISDTAIGAMAKFLEVQDESINEWKEIHISIVESPVL